MTRGQALGLAAAAVALSLAGAWAVDGGTTIRAAGTGIGIRLGLSAGRDTDEPLVPGGVPARHGLYRRFDGHAMRAVLTAPGGWAWFADPPSEVTL